MHVNSSKDLAAFIIDQRKRLKLSQSEVGKSVGLKQQTVSEFELRPENTKLDTLFRILAALNLDIKVVAKDKTTSVIGQWHEEW